jgi:hypothetical protein
MLPAELDDADDRRPVRIPLSVNDPNAGRSLTRSVERLLSERRGSVPVLVELHGSHLPAPLIAALIGNLRRVREVGGALIVNAAAPGVSSALALHGLDRVLSNSAAAIHGAGRAERRFTLGEAAAPAFALLLLTATVAAVAIVLQFSPGINGL